MNVPSPPWPQGGEQGGRSMNAAETAEGIGGLAERTQSLLNEVKRWPLAVAVDYLMEAGFACLDGVSVLRPGRMPRLRTRVKWVFRREGPDGWGEVRLHDLRGKPARVEWLQPGQFGIPQRLWLAGHAAPATFFLDAPDESRGWGPLPFLVPGALAWISERCLCELAILLNCAERCYRRE